MKKRIGIWLLFAALIVLLAMPAQAAKVSLNKKKATITVGKTLKLKLSGVKASKVKWSSSGKAVASVSRKGVVQAKKAGKATITARVGKKKYTCKVTVKALTTAEYYQMLIQYIQSKGSVNSDNNRFILKPYTDEGNTSKSGIIYESTLNRLQFISIFDGTISGMSVTSPLSMYVNLVSNSNVSPQISVVVKDTLGFTASASFYAPSYTRQSTVDFSLETGTAGVTLDSIQEISNTFLDLAMVGWEDLLYTKVGITLRDLGFSSFAVS